MNSILMIVVAVVIILLVFVMFSLDDQEGAVEEDLGLETDEVARQPPEKGAPVASNSLRSSGSPGSSGASGASGSSGSAGSSGATGSSSASGSSGSPGSSGISGASRIDSPDEATVEQDLQFRLTLEDQVAPVTGISLNHPVVAVVQIRFPEAIMGDPASLVKALGRAEAILASQKSPFPYQVGLLSQLSQIWLFGIDEERDDVAFEAVVAAYSTVSRFKKALESDPALFEAKARVSIGMSIGEMARVIRGPLGPITYVGKSVYMAETLSEAAGDFQVFLDEQMHRLAQSWFDFREWKSMKLRPPLPPVAFFEVVGWSKKEEVFAFAGSKEWTARRAVAVAYRYLDFDDVAPLLALLSDSDERVALEALATLSEIKDNRGLGILKMILPEAKSSALRSSIIKAMGDIGKEEVIPILLASTKDVHWQVRLNAMRALYGISGRDSLKHIGHLVDDENGAVRAGIHEILFSCDRDERHISAIRELLGDLSQRARKAAIESLIQIKTRESLMLIAHTYFDQELELRRYSLRLLRDVNSPDIYSCFLFLFQHSDEKGRPEIVTALRRSQFAG